MNCKPGDLAIVVRRGPDRTCTGEFIGAVVQCVKFLGCVPYGTASDYWQLDRTLGVDHLGIYSDSLLMPLRDGTDDIALTVKPEEVTA